MQSHAEKYLTILNKHLSAMLQEARKGFKLTKEEKFSDKMIITMMTSCFLAGTQEKQKISLKI